MMVCAFPYLAFSVVEITNARARRPFLADSDLELFGAVRSDWFQFLDRVGMVDVLEDKRRKQGTTGNSGVERSCDVFVYSRTLEHSRSPFPDHPPGASRVETACSCLKVEAVPVRYFWSGISIDDTFLLLACGICACQPVPFASHVDDLIHPNHHAHARRDALARIVRFWRLCTSIFFIFLQRLFFPSFNNVFNLTANTFLSLQLHREV